MNTKTVHQLDDEGFYVGSSGADESPLEPGVFLIPAGCVEPEPPPHVEGMRRRFEDGGWSYVSIPAPEPEAPQTREDIEQSQWLLIRAERDRRQACGVAVGGHWFHTDIDSRIKWLGLDRQAEKVLAAGGTPDTILQKLGQDIMWKTMSGDFVPVTVQVAFDVVAATGDLDALVFAAAERHKAAMEASQAPEQYDFTGDWPAAFGDEGVTP
jgi:hypothetical protein